MRILVRTLGTRGDAQPLAAAHGLDLVRIDDGWFLPAARPGLPAAVEEFLAAGEPPVLVGSTAGDDPARDHPDGDAVRAAGMRAIVATGWGGLVAGQPFWPRRAHGLGVGPAPVPQRRMTARGSARRTAPRRPSGPSTRWSADDRAAASRPLRCYRSRAPYTFSTVMVISTRRSDTMTARYPSQSGCSPAAAR